MTVPSCSWQDMTAAQKRERVKAMILSGQRHDAIAKALGAPSKGSIASVASSLRVLGEIGNSLTRREVGDESRMVARVQRAGAVVKQAAPALTALNIAIRAESRADDKGLPISRAAAFEPLAGIEPAPFATSSGCLWPVDGLEGSGLLVCGCQREAGRPYCAAHVRIAYTSNTERAA